ncbi:hypothetical protein ACFFNY_11860 [Paenibacillus hodogayensis]|uniref:Uncharacterized protein n=1 Tax=Paenibacillus hodogayensis TaxID=279208 RepID=A0ABV5VVF7_9BACL
MEGLAASPRPESAVVLAADDYRSPMREVEPRFEGGKLLPPPLAVARLRYRLGFDREANG